MTLPGRRPPAAGRGGGPAGPPPDVGAQDDGLLTRVADGDTGAFEQLYARYAARVHGVVRTVLRNPALAEEVTQEVFVEIWRTAARYDAGRGSVRAWVVMMARRRAIDRVRSEQAAGDREGRAAAGAATTAYDEVSETVEVRLEQQQVRRCLDALTGLQRQSIELAFYRGFSHREVSDLLSVPLGTVKTRLRDGLIRLRDCVGVA